MSKLYENYINVVNTTPTKIALIYEGKKITYKEFDEKVNIIFSRLSEFGVSSNSNVGLMIETLDEYMMFTFALIKKGANIVPINHHIKTGQVYDAIAAADIDCIICNSITKRQLSNSEHLKNCLIIDANECFSIFEMKDNGDNLIDQETSILLMTSGSTGTPKVTIINETIIKNRINVEYEFFGFSSNDVVLISTPLYHCMGYRMAISSLCTGATTVIIKGFTPEKWCKQIEKYNVTFTTTVPVHIGQILEFVDKSRYPLKTALSSVRKLMSTSSYLPPHMRKEFQQYVTGDFYNYLASSETEFIAIVNCNGDIDDNCIGYPFPGAELKIFDGEREVKQGEIGEILFKSKTICNGYYKNTELNIRSFYNGYFRTGDLGYIDNKGMLHYSGRKKNMIICSGVNIIPEDIEASLMKIRGVIDCHVFGIPNKKTGEIPAALIVSNGVTEDEIKKHCLETLSIYQQVRKFIFVDAVPKTGMGKIDKKKINEYISMLSKEN